MMIKNPQSESTYSIALSQPQQKQEIVIPEVVLDAKRIEYAQHTAKDLVNKILSYGYGSQEFTQCIREVENLGKQTIEKCTSLCSDLSTLSTDNLHGIDNDKNSVAQKLSLLKSLVEKLDPGNYEDLTVPKKRNNFFGIALNKPQHNLDNYIEKFSDGQKVLNTVLESLLYGKDDLFRMNARISVNSQYMKEYIQDLLQVQYIITEITKAVRDKVEEFKNNGDLENSKKLSSEVLFITEQKRVDIGTQLTINFQGLVAGELIVKGNQELVKAVDRTRTTTISALNIAAATVNAITADKKVMEQVDQLQLESKKTHSLLSLIGNKELSDTPEKQEKLTKINQELSKLSQTMASMKTSLEEADTSKKQLTQTLQIAANNVGKKSTEIQAYIDDNSQKELPGKTIENTYENTNEEARKEIVPTISF